MLEHGKAQSTTDRFESELVSVQLPVGWAASSGGRGEIVEGEIPLGGFGGAAEHGAEGLQEGGGEFEGEAAFPRFAQGEGALAVAGGFDAGFGGEQRRGTQGEDGVFVAVGLGEIGGRRQAGGRRGRPVWRGLDGKGQRGLDIGGRGFDYAADDVIEIRRTWHFDSAIRLY